VAASSETTPLSVHFCDGEGGGGGAGADGTTGATGDDGPSSDPPHPATITLNASADSQVNRRIIE
jgi:hypothetical protein